MTSGAHSAEPAEVRAEAAIQDAQQCANCGVYEGTIRWGDALSLTHGFAEMWCEGCALRAQIAHAEERAAMLDGLRARLTEWERATESRPQAAATDETGL